MEILIQSFKFKFYYNCVYNVLIPYVQALHFRECDNLFLSGLTHINSPKNHISIIRCNNSLISKIHMIAPDESPNTDGIDISQSSNIVIKNSKMETGKSYISVRLQLHNYYFLSLNHAMRLHSLLVPRFFLRLLKWWICS